MTNFSSILQKNFMNFNFYNWQVTNKLKILFLLSLQIFNSNTCPLNLQKFYNIDFYFWSKQNFDFYLQPRGNFDFYLLLKDCKRCLKETLTLTFDQKETSTSTFDQKKTSTSTFGLTGIFDF